MKTLPPSVLASELAAVTYPESDGQPMGETELHIAEIIELRLMLRRHLRAVPDALVASNMFVYYEEGDPSRVFCPDVFVAFGSDKHARRTYKVWLEGHGPTVVFEVTSRKTWLEDEGNKKALCAHLGVAEYYMYDPEGDYLDPALQGYHLIGGQYGAIPPDDMGRIQSQALGLTFGLEGGLVVVRDGATNERLLRAEEVEELLRDAQARAAANERRAAANELRAAEEQAGRRAAEAEVARLREELQRLSPPPTD